MKDTWSRRWFTIAALSVAVAGAKPQRCDVCNRLLSKKYLSYAGRLCCSQECVERILPTCSTCGKPISGRSVISDDKSYCSQSCYKTTLPKCDICNAPIMKGFTVARHRYCDACFKDNPTCFSCGLPTIHSTRLYDGREICPSCMRWSVKTQKHAQQHYERARRQLEAWTSLKFETVPELVLVDRDEIQRLGKSIRKSDSPVSIRGLYSRQTTTTTSGLLGILKGKKREQTTEEENIYLINHLHDEVFRVAAMHELMHDLIHEHFPRLETAPLWVHEGICQQAAAEYCRRGNYGDILHGIENCTDPDYGDGYRYVNKLTGFTGWRALRRWMETVDVAALPKTAPK